MNLSLGSWVTLSNPSVAEIMADAGFDWLCIDMEHSVIDFFGAQQLIIAIQGKGLKAFVRVGENCPLIIKRVLDAGADGIIVPMVNSKFDAERAVSYARYPPLGKRGVGLARAQSYGSNFEEYRDEKSKQICIIVQIEHIDGIRNLDEILSVDGINGTFIGPYDLSGSLGKPGQWEEPDVLTAIDNYENVARKYNKFIGVHVIEPDYNLVLEKQKNGYNFIAFSLDILFLGNKVKFETKQLRKNQ